MDDDRIETGCRGAIAETHVATQSTTPDSLPSSVDADEALKEEDDSPAAAPKEPPKIIARAEERGIIAQVGAKLLTGEDLDVEDWNNLNKLSDAALVGFIGEHSRKHNRVLHSAVIDDQDEILQRALTLLSTDGLEHELMADNMMGVSLAQFMALNRKEAILMHGLSRLSEKQLLNVVAIVSPQGDNLVHIAAENRCNEIVQLCAQVLSGRNGTFAFNSENERGTIAVDLILEKCSFAAITNVLERSNLWCIPRVYSHKTAERMVDDISAGMLLDNVPGVERLFGPEVASRPDIAISVYQAVVEEISKELGVEPSSKEALVALKASLDLSAYFSIITGTLRRFGAQLDSRGDITTTGQTVCKTLLVEGVAKQFAKRMEAILPHEDALVAVQHINTGWGVMTHEPSADRGERYFDKAKLIHIPLQSLSAVEFWRPILEANFEDSVDAVYAMLAGLNVEDTSERRVLKELPFPHDIFFPINSRSHIMQLMLYGHVDDDLMTEADRFSRIQTLATCWARSVQEVVRRTLIRRVGRVEYKRIAYEMKLRIVNLLEAHNKQQMSLGVPRNKRLEKLIAVSRIQVERARQRFKNTALAAGNHEEFVRDMLERFQQVVAAGDEATRYAQESLSKRFPGISDSQAEAWLKSDSRTLLEKTHILKILSDALR